MARSLSLSQTLTRLSPLFSSPLRRSIRHRSDRPCAAAAGDLHSDAAGDADEPGPTSLALLQLDDALKWIVARRSAPDWLPFLPGSSYWVPPPRRPPSDALADLISTLENALSKEEAFSLISPRGCPSSAFFIHCTSPHPVELGLTSKRKSDSEDDEG